MLKHYNSPEIDIINIVGTDVIRTSTLVQTGNENDQDFVWGWGE